MQRSKVPHKALGSVRALSSLRPEAVVDFNLIGVNATLPCGATFFKENAPGEAVCPLLGTGRATCTSREGRILLLGMAVLGDVLGLSAVI
jgi:CRP/FNR family transcriptional regulator